MSIRIYNALFEQHHTRQHASAQIALQEEPTALHGSAGSAAEPLTHIALRRPTLTSDSTTALLCGLLFVIFGDGLQAQRFFDLRNKGRASTAFINKTACATTDYRYYLPCQ